ncbi:endonuclease/exonuclease/phosphatase family protein [Chondromyces crocatus]|uniref:Endonuclease/exonuclease/phosphatase domain-containing protein n=1 Tax=Chondromyces crocatus TaxID=52 RepID=A0A0K1EDZ6_CHOCO|nr:endonuclease/exonuclease/phosphatase family protein [Chondromyces crocatus]AKT39064.1 uncharacterized protein CMC5_032110 [Chondromyces crocatus]
MDRLRVVTLNIWSRRGPWTERLRLIRAELQTLNPDLVGLQEVISHPDGSQAHEIAAGLGYAVAFGRAQTLPDGDDFGNAVLSRWPIVRQETYPLPTNEHDEPRSLLLAEVDAPAGRIPMFVTHLNWKFHHGAIRERQVVAISEVIHREGPIDAPTIADPSDLPPGFPPILVGDLNAQPDSTEVRYLKGLHALGGRSTFFSDVFEITGDGPGHTYDPARNPFAAGHREHPRRIDYILVRGPDRAGRGKALTARLVFQDVSASMAASDHFGVYAELTV